MHTYFDVRGFIRLLLLRIVSTVSVLSIIAVIMFSKAYAAGVSNMAVSLSVSTVSSLTVATVTFNPNTAYVNGTTITVSWPSSTFTGGASLTNTDITVTKPSDPNFTSATSSGFSATGFTITLTTGGALNTTNGFSIVIGGSNKLTTPASAQNIAVSFITSGATPDYGSGLAYVAGANQVTVSATVTSSISFVIRNAAETSTVSTCALGTLTTTAINYCQYRLRVGTNAANGFSVSYTANNGLQRTSPTYTFTAASGAVISNGTEAYGANLFPNSITGGTTTAGTGAVGCSTIIANCNAGATTSSANFFSYQSASPVQVYTGSGTNNPTASPDTTNTALVTHAATPNAATAAGSYSSIVTYTVTGSF